MFHLPTYKEHKDREARVKSAVTAIKAIILLNLYPAHKRELLDICIWKITEADGKLKTRYRSIDSLQSNSETKLQHEHVIEKQKLVSALIAGQESIEDIVEMAIGCVVTKAEHRILTAVSRSEPTLDGWNRYKKAGIKVFDLKTQREVEF